MSAAQVEQSKPTEPSAENFEATTAKNFYFVTSGYYIWSTIEILLGIIIVPLSLYILYLLVVFWNWPTNFEKKEQILVAYLLTFLDSTLIAISESIRNPFDEKEKHSKGALLWCGLRAFVALFVLILLMDEVFGINSFSVYGLVWAIAACICLIALYFYLETHLLKRLHEHLTNQTQDPTFLIVVIKKQIV